MKQPVPPRHSAMPLDDAALDRALDSVASPALPPGLAARIMRDVPQLPQLAPLEDEGAVAAAASPVVAVPAHHGGRGWGRRLAWGSGLAAMAAGLAAIILPMVQPAGGLSSPGVQMAADSAQPAPHVYVDTTQRDRLVRADDAPANAAAALAPPQPAPRPIPIPRVVKRQALQLAAVPLAVPPTPAGAAPVVTPATSTGLATADRPPLGPAAPEASDSPAMGPPMGPPMGPRGIMGPPAPQGMGYAPQGMGYAPQGGLPTSSVPSSSMPSGRPPR